MPPISLTADNFVRFLTVKVPFFFLKKLRVADWSQYNNIRGIKIRVYAKRQTTDSSWEFLRIDREVANKTFQNNSYV